MSMELLLRAHENPADPVWSVIFLVLLATAGASYYIYYLIKLAFDEYEGEDRPKHWVQILSLCAWRHKSNLLYYISQGNKIKLQVSLYIFTYYENIIWRLQSQCARLPLGNHSVSGSPPPTTASMWAGLVFWWFHVYSLQPHASSLRLSQHPL